MARGINTLRLLSDRSVLPRAQWALGSQQIHKVWYYPFYSHMKPKFHAGSAPQMRIHRALRLLSLLLLAAVQHSGAAAAADGPSAAARPVGRQGLASFLRRSTDAVSARRLAPGDFDKVRSATTRPTLSCIRSCIRHTFSNIILTHNCLPPPPFTTPHPQLNSIFATSKFLFPDIDENIKAYTTGCVPAFWFVQLIWVNCSPQHPCSPLLSPA